MSDNEMKTERDWSRQPLRVLILSSTEALPVARAVQSELNVPAIEPTVWDQASFSGWLLTDIRNKIVEYGFVVVVFSPDDLIVSRGSEMLSPRDNVLLELGMALASNGIERTSLLCPDMPNIKIPIDLGGLAVKRYEHRSDGNYRASVAPACSEIVSELRALAVDGIAMTAPFFYRAVADLNKRLVRNPRERPDVLIGVNHGGAIVGSILYYLNRQLFHFTVFWIDVDSSLRTRNLRQEDARREFHMLVQKLVLNGKTKPIIVLVDDTLRSGRAMGPALDIVRDVAPEADVRIGVIVYRPDMATAYNPDELSPMIYTPDPLRFPIGAYDRIFYE